MKKELRKAFFLLALTLVASSANAAKMLCEGRDLEFDKQGYQKVINYSLMYGIHDKDRFHLEISTDKKEARRLGSDNYILYGGHGKQTSNLNKIELTATGQVTFFPNYGPMSTGKHFKLGELEIVNSQVIILTMMNDKKVGLTCKFY